MRFMGALRFLRLQIPFCAFRDFVVPVEPCSPLCRFTPRHCLNKIISPCPRPKNERRMPSETLKYAMLNNDYSIFSPFGPAFDRFKAKAGKETER